MSAIGSISAQAPVQSAPPPPPAVKTDGDGDHDGSPSAGASGKTGRAVNVVA